jgi:hypothetical protein
MQNTGGSGGGTVASLGMRGPERYFRVFCLTGGDAWAWIVRLVALVQLR